MAILINKILDEVRVLGCSDLHFTNGINPVVRLNGQLRKMSGYEEMNEEGILEIVEQMTNEQQRRSIAQHKDTDFSFTTRSGYRHRVNVFFQRGWTIRQMRIFTLPSVCCATTSPPWRICSCPRSWANLQCAPEGLCW